MKIFIVSTVGIVSAGFVSKGITQKVSVPVSYLPQNNITTNTALPTTSPEIVVNTPKPKPTSSIPTSAPRKQSQNKQSLKKVTIPPRGKIAGASVIKALRRLTSR